jgi:hypothetical protein
MTQCRDIRMECKLFDFFRLPGFWTSLSSDILKNTVRGWEVPALFNPLERANLIEKMFLTCHLKDGNRSNFRNVVFFTIPVDGQSPKTQ